jgi:hypothetical protein
VKNFAKLILSFTFSFIGILILAGLAGVLRGWANTALLFPPAALPALSTLLAAALPVSFYFSLLFGISYSSRRRIPYVVSLVSLLALSLGLAAAASTALGRFEKMNLSGSSETAVFGSATAEPNGTGTAAAVSAGAVSAGAAPVMTVPTVPVQPGLVLTITPGDTPTRAVLLGAGPESARVLSLPGQALFFEPASTLYRARQVRLPFREERNGSLSGISADFAGSARVFRAWFNAGLAPFAVYAGSLSLFLVSLGCLVNISFWPLANLFFGAMAFRGALALENFLNTAETHQLLSSFAGNIIPESLVNPIIFTVLGILILLYSGLVYLARGRRSE